MLAIWFVIDVEGNDTAALSPSDNTTGGLNDDGCSAANTTGGADESAGNDVQVRVQIIGLSAHDARLILCAHISAACLEMSDELYTLP